jgi:hypothetical protein
MANEKLIDKVFSVFSGGEDGDRRLMLQKIQRDLSQNKYAKFFKARSEELDPALAGVLHTVYRILYPLQPLLRDSVKLRRLRTCSVKAFLDGPSREAVQRLSYDQAEDLSGMDIGQLKDDLDSLTAAFDEVRMTAIDRCYNLVDAMVHLAGFNYVAFLTKFDEHFQSVPTYQPRFQAVKAAGLLKDLQAFLLLLPPLDPNGDWKHALDVVNEVIANGKPVTRASIPQGPWINIARYLRDVQSSAMLEQIIQYTLKDPLWVAVRKNDDQTLAEDWLAEKKAAAEKMLSRIADSQRDQRIAALAKSVFGTSDASRLANYTPKASDNLVRKGLVGYTCAKGLSYLKAFIEDYVNRELGELLDIVLVRGQWTNQAMSREMSEAFYQLKNDRLPEIDDLDESLGEKGREGPRVNAAVLRVEHDPTQLRYVNSIINGLNDTALESISEAVSSLQVLVKHLKNLTEDCQKRPPDIIINWRELNQVSRTPIVQRIADAFEKVSTFCQLEQLYTDTTPIA